MNDLSARKLVVFKSYDEVDDYLYATVAASMDDGLIQRFVAAAISDAAISNVDSISELGSDTHEPEVSTNGFIRQTLEPLGFEFLKRGAVFSNENWDSGYMQKETVTEVRLQLAGVKYEVLPETGLLHIATDKGGITVLPKQLKWQCIPRKEGDSNLSGDDFGTMVRLVALRGQLCTV